MFATSRTDVVLVGDTRSTGCPERSKVMYQQRYLKPSWLVSRVANPLLMWFGAVPTLHVQGRKTGAGAACWSTSSSWATSAIS
jgi:hypothetical protein